VYGRLQQQQTREVFHKRPSMIFRSPETIEQTLKRRLFNQPTMQAVAEQDLVGKSVNQASRKLQELGFDGNLHSYGWHEPHECKRVTNVFVGISLFVEKEMVKSVIVKLFGQCQGKNWC
jgi:hypothetical protein